MLGVQARGSLAEARAAPAGLAWDRVAGADAFVRFAQERHAVVNEALPTR